MCMFDKINILLKNGGLIAFPTDTVWGIGCLPTHPQAVEKIYELKGRDKSKPLILMSHDLSFLLPYTQLPFSEKAEKLAQKHWPGALTLVVNKSDKVPNYTSANLNTIGIRVPNCNIFQELCRHIEGHVLATTSANLSGQPPATNYQEAMKVIGDKVDYTIFSDEKISKKSSTVIGFHNDTPIVFRQGDIII